MSKVGRFAGTTRVPFGMLSALTLLPGAHSGPAKDARHTGKERESRYESHEGVGEIARRQRQIAAGQLRAANGLSA